VPEPSHYQPRQEYPHAFAISIHDVRTGPPYEGELGEGVLLRTDRGGYPLKAGQLSVGHVR